MTSAIFTPENSPVNLARSSLKGFCSKLKLHDAYSGNRFLALEPIQRRVPTTITRSTSFRR